MKTDPGEIAPPVLRAMKEVLAGHLSPELVGRLEAAAGLVGIAGLWSALLNDGKPLALLTAALEEAIAAVERYPQSYRRAGSDLCSSALGMSQSAAQWTKNIIGRASATGR